FVVLHVSQDNPSLALYTITGQRHNNAGSNVGSVFTVRTSGMCATAPNVATLPTGGFVVVWKEGCSRGNTCYDVYLQRFDETATPIGNTLRVNTTLTGDQVSPIVTGLANGAFTVAWVSKGQDGSGDGVYAQRYSKGGTRAGSEFKVNTTTQGDQNHP